MINHISINNFAIIENTEIDFEDGLNIITGETGSGKSIVIEAISLALGSRADSAFCPSRRKQSGSAGGRRAERRRYRHHQRGSLPPARISAGLTANWSPWVNCQRPVTSWPTSMVSTTTNPFSMRKITSAWWTAITGIRSNLFAGL